MKRGNDSAILALIATVVAGALTIAFSTACRAEGQLPAKLALSEAVSKALDVNANIKQAEAFHLTSLSTLKIARFTSFYGAGAAAGLEHDPGGYQKSLRTFGSLTYEGVSGAEASVDLIPFGFGADRSALSMAFRKPLGSGSGMFSKKADLIAGAASDATVQEKQLYLTRQNTVIGVVQAYYQAVLAREQVKVQDQALAIAEEAATGAKKRADAGLVRGIDVSRAELNVAQTRDQLNLQKQAARTAKDSLMAAIGVGVGEDPELVDGIPEPPTDIPGLALAVKTALANRVELSVFDEKLSNQKRKVELAIDRLRPQVDLVAGFTSANQDAGVLSSSLVDQGRFNAGIEYHFPVDKRIDNENKETAKRDLDVLDRLRAFQMEDVTEQVRTAYSGVQTARTTLGILSENVKVARENLSLAQRMVEEGIDDNRIVLDAQDSLTQVQSGLLSAKVDLYIAAVNLKYSMGQDLADMGSK